MNKYEVPAYLEDAIPEMKELLVKNGVSSDIFDPNKSLQCLANFAITNARDENKRMLRRCLRAADKIYMKGNESVRMVLKNVFVKSFSSFFAEFDTKEEALHMNTLMTGLLYSMYLKHILR